MPNKRVSVYLNNADLQLLDEFCKTHGCSQSSALKSMLYRSKNEALRPVAPDPVTAAAPEIHPGDFVFHEGLLDKEARLQKEEHEKRLAKARAEADAYINSAPDFVSKMMREGNVREKIKQLLGEMNDGR